MIEPRIVREMLAGGAVLLCCASCQAPDMRAERLGAPQVDGVSLALNAEPDEPLLDKVFDAEIVDGQRGEVQVGDLPAGAHKRDPEPKADKPAEPVGDPPKRIGAKLQLDVDAVAAGTAPDQKVEVVVTFNKELHIPRFPTLIEDEDRDSPDNQAALQRAQELKAQIEQKRAANYDARAREFGQIGATERDRFWLINGMVLELPLSAVEALAERGDVQHVEYRVSDATRPSGSVADARTLLQSDPYFSASGYIGLLDSGVRKTHTLLSSTLGFVRDCISNTNSSCSTGTDTNDTCNHGTASAAAITGNGNLGNASRGVTGIILDSFKTGLGCGVDVAATVRGYQAAIGVLDRVIIDEDQDGGSETGAIATAADAAFDAGAVVVSAAGNSGPGTGTVSSPGKAHKVLAIGAIDVTNQALQGYSGRGPTSDGRIKPDLVAPTNVNTASNASDTALFTFTGTSCATPFGTGAAALARNWLRGSNFEFAPGQVNAFMIMSGAQRYFDNNSGAGLINLPLNGHAWWGSVTVTNGQVVDVPLSIGTPTSKVDAAIWWPESTTVHNDVDLTLLRPGGGTADASLSGNSVFEKVRATTTLTSGTWTLRIKGYSVTGSQVVYYALFRL